MVKKTIKTLCVSMSLFLSGFSSHAAEEQQGKSVSAGVLAPLYNAEKCVQEFVSQPVISSLPADYQPCVGTVMSGSFCALGQHLIDNQAWNATDLVKGTNLSILCSGIALLYYSQKTSSLVKYGMDIALGERILPFVALAGAFGGDDVAFDVALKVMLPIIGACMVCNVRPHTILKHLIVGAVGAFSYILIANKINGFSR